jgi:hypothetical protein
VFSGEQAKLKPKKKNCPLKKKSKLLNGGVAILLKNSFWLI